MLVQSIFKHLHDWQPYTHIPTAAGQALVSDQQSSKSHNRPAESQMFGSDGHN